MTSRRWRRTLVLVGAAGVLASTLTACRGTSVLELGVGDCLNSSDLSGDRVENLATVDCEEPHDAEVFASTELPEGDYPGVEAVRSAAENFCLPEFDAFVGVAYLDSEFDVYPLLPTEEGWNSLDDREILCIVVAPEDVTGTLEGAAR